jgi:hypothetical protein
MLAGCMHAYYARVVGGQLGALSCKIQPDISRSFRRMLCVCEDKREVAGAEANTLWRFEDLWQSQKGTSATRQTEIPLLRGAPFRGEWTKHRGVD